MPAQVVSFPPPSFRPPVRQVSIDGEFADDEMPPELFDRDEDFEELAFYAHLAEQAHDE